MYYVSDIRKQIQEQIDIQKNSLAYGAASTYSEYQHAVGYVAGLEDALAIAIDVLKQKVEFDDEIEG